MNKIIILIPYYGRWPGSIQLFNQSCRVNGFIDFIFLTDLAPFPDPSANISFYNISHSGLKERISSVFNISVEGHKPYKLCDFRPAFGVIFEDIIKNYDFWGHSDVDLIFGNLRKFLPHEVLINHDIICFRPDHLHGPFTLYRNLPEINTLFQRAENYRDIFADDKYLSFDEFGDEGFHLRKDTPIEAFHNSTISIIAMKAAQNNEISLYLKSHSIEKICLSNVILIYKNNSLLNYMTGEEYAFYHWVWEKRATYFRVPSWVKIPCNYFILSTGFYNATCFPFVFFLHHILKITGILKWTLLKASNYLKRKFKLRVITDTYPVPGLVQHYE